MRMRGQFVECSCQVRSANCTDMAEILSHDDIRLDRFQLRQIDEVKGSPSGNLVSYRLIDFLRREAAVNQCVYYNRLLAGVRRVVAFERHACDAFTHSEGVNDLSRCWKK